ncbi:MAG: ATP-binding protein [Nitrosomonadales bacterium]
MKTCFPCLFLPPLYGWHLLEKHSSQPANPDIANTFFRAGKIESWGRGIDLIRHECLAEGYPAPKFSCDSAGIWIEFAFPKNSPVNTGEVTGEVTGKVARLLQVCKQAMSRRELCESLGLKGEDNFRRLYLLPALNAGLIEMTIPGKPNSRLHHGSQR